MRDRTYWENELRDTERTLRYTLGWKFLFCPWKTIQEAKVAFLSLNPGRASAHADLRVVSDERGNSYVVERDTTVSPITEQYLELCKLVNIDASAVLAGVIMPFRTQQWAPRRDAAGLEVGKQFWREVLPETKLRTIFAVGRVTAKTIAELCGARAAGELPAGWGSCRISLYEDGAGRRIIGLPHLSRFRLLSTKRGRQQISQAYSGKVKMLEQSYVAVAHSSEAHGVAERPALPAGLPPDVRKFFQFFGGSSPLRYEVMKMQVAVYFNGEKVGGLNPRNKHWYLSKIFLGKRNGAPIAERFGFKKVEKDGRHQYWMFQGLNGYRSFAEVVSKLTHTRIQ